MRISSQIKKKPYLLSSLIGFLILLYLTGSLQLDSIHRLIHKHDDRSVHTIELEQNACHRSVFHQNTENSCNHPTHFSELKKCPWCFGSIQHESILTGSFALLEKSYPKKSFQHFQESLIVAETYSAGIRGPPTK